MSIFNQSRHGLTAVATPQADLDCSFAGCPNSRVLWRVAQAFDLAGITNTAGPSSFALLAKGGSRKCRCQVGSITCL